MFALLFLSDKTQPRAALAFDMAKATTGAADTALTKACELLQLGISCRPDHGEVGQDQGIKDAPVIGLKVLID